ncbi:MAG: Rieske 2Fe-2S domain-containing protein [Haloarculaceae archaeon]|jgi:nitrite reductase/ring-hydroxylating ferredoxin subunit
MTVRTRLTELSEVPEVGSSLFTVRERGGDEEEVILVRCEGEAGPVTAWKNFCQHETDQRLDRGVGNGVVMRDGGVVCPKHGSVFDACSGHCDNGKAAGSTLVEVGIEVEDGTVYLTDEDLTYRHEGGIDDDGDVPGSSSHLTF